LLIFAKVDRRLNSRESTTTPLALKTTKTAALPLRLLSFR
jgi:hypothetical protein